MKKIKINKIFVLFSGFFEEFINISLFLEIKTQIVRF